MPETLNHSSHPEPQQDASQPQATATSLPSDAATTPPEAPPPDSAIAPAPTPSPIAAAGTSFRFQDWAFVTLKKHVKKATKYRKKVLADTDPEPLHQMRVGLRRLRTAVDVFAPAIALPAHITDQRLRYFARILGNVRDLDVLRLWLVHYQVNTDISEQDALKTLIKKLDKQRKKQFKALSHALKGKSFALLEAQLKQWCAEPTFRDVSILPMHDVLPDLLMPLVNRILLHPGWLIATEPDESGYRRPITTLEPDAIQATLTLHRDRLHDLRKQMKQLRYQTEGFQDFYGEEYAAQIQEFSDIQELLGHLNDQAVLTDFIVKTLGENWSSSLPKLAAQFQREQLDIWHQWQPVQHRYLQADGRDRLRQLIVSPPHHYVAPSS